MNNASRWALVGLASTVALHAQADPELIRTRDATIRAFRESPSLGRFSEAGTAIMQASDWRAFDRPDPSPPPKNRDFEAMKTTLAAGVMVSMSVLPAPTQLSPNQRVKLNMLPPVRRSFFDRNESLFVIALRPFKLVDEDVIPLVDALTAVNRITMRVRVAELMSFGNNGPLGSWDVGSVEVRFDRDAVVHGIARDGQITGYSVQSVRAPVGWQYCSDRGGSVIGTRVNAGWSSAVVAWIGKAAPANATVTTRTSGGAGVHDKLVTETIDLDRDGVADFSTWAGIDKSAIVEEIDIPWKAVFVNLGGSWFLGSYRSAPDCT